MNALFPKLFGVVVTILTAYCILKAHDLKMSPFKVSVYNFILVILFILLAFGHTVETEKVVWSALACHFTMAGLIHLITNDAEKYKQGAKVWINSMTLLIVITGILLLWLDYPNTKSTLHSLAIGFTSSFVGEMFLSRASWWRKEAENL